MNIIRANTGASNRGYGIIDICVSPMLVSVIPPQFSMGLLDFFKSFSSERGLLMVSGETIEWGKSVGLSVCFCKPLIDIYFEHDIGLCKKCGDIV